ncbi:MAG: PAS domain S-box protein [Desulfobacterales bacterium]|nr:PAS domain S-box protein [Desulfobacterales bacterium]
MSGKPTYEELEQRVRELEQAESERKEVEDTLRESESRLREAQRLAHMGNWSWDVNSGKVEWSNEVFKIFRLDPKVFTPQIDSILDLSPWPEDHQRDKELIQKAVESREVGSYEQRFLRPDGSTGYYFSSFQGIYDDNGKLTAINGVVQDITERKQAEEEIRSATSFIDRVVDMSPFAMWISDREGTVIRTNSSLRETLNMSDDKIVGQYNVLKDENLETQGVMPMVMAVFENHEPANFSIPWKASTAGDVNFDGARDLYIDVSIFPIVSAEGELTNAVCQWVDITEHKKNEESLRESHEKFKSIVDNIGIGVALISPAMEILEMNHQMREWFTEHDLDKRPICYRTFNNPPREEICEYCPTCKTLKDGKVHEDTTARPQADKTRNYRIVSSPLINPQGEVTAAIEMVEDITERLNLQAQLIQAQKMESVGLLAGGIAHDYNNISSVIIGYSELALEKVDQNDPLHDDLIAILTAANRSTNITRQLLAFARQQTIAPKVLDLNGTIETMLKMLRRLIGEDINLAWRPGVEVWPVKIDPSQVDQILANLCVNARDAIAGVGKITIETGNVSFDENYCADHAGFVPGEYVLLAVSDDGSGIAPETLDKIFEPFFTTKEFGHGTGLGLATVYGIVKQNNGFINIYSEPDEGTTIKIYLSRHSGDIEALHKSTLENPISRGETVLLVEDDRSIMELGTRMLNDLGYSVLSATIPGEAIRLAKEHAGEINLLVTDVVLPEMNGRELSEQLKIPCPNLKILFMSGYTANVIAHRGVLEDGVCFMPKPFSKKDLAAKVREALDNDNG